MERDERDLSVAPLPEGDESELVRLLQRDSMTLNEDGAELKQTLKLQAPVACVAFSQGGSLLAGGSRDGVVRIWNMDDTSVQHVLRGHRDRVWSLSFSPGQGAGGSDRRPTTVSVSARPCLQILDFDQLSPTITMETFYSPGGSQLASASWDKTVRLWDPRSGQLQHILKAHTVDYSVTLTAGLPTLADSSARGLDPLNRWMPLLHPSIPAYRSQYGQSSSVQVAISFSPAGWTTASMSGIRER